MLSQDNGSKKQVEIPHRIHSLAATSLSLSASVGSLQSLHSIVLANLHSIRLHISNHSYSSVKIHLPNIPRCSHRSLRSQCCYEFVRQSSRKPIRHEMNISKSESYLLDVGSSLGRGLQENQTILLSKLGSLLGGDGTTRDHCNEQRQTGGSDRTCFRST